MMYRGESKTPPIGALSTINAENNPDGLAFADNSGNEITWRAFEEHAERVAGALSEYVRHGDRVGFLCESTVDTAVVWTGAVKAGAITSFAHTQSAPETIRYTIDQLRPAVLVIHEEYSEFVNDRIREQMKTEPVVVVIGDANYDYEQSLAEFVAKRDASVPDTYLREDDIAAVIWTSGTTGDPKGWCHSYRNLVMKAGDRGVIIDRTATRMSQTMPSLGGWYKSVIGTLLSASSLVFLGDWEPERWARFVEEYGVTHGSMVPSMWREVLDLNLDVYDLSTLENVLCIGEKVEPTTLGRIREEICEDVTNAYASTEVDVSLLESDEFTEDRLASVGKPSGGTRVRIIEENADPDDTLPADEVGEIIVKGPDRPVWAWQGSKVVDEEFTDGWWYSGDLGYKDEEGFLYLEGRKDFMIKTKGVKVFPSPIEGVLNDYPGVEEAVVIGIEDMKFGEKVTAVVKRSDHSVTAEDLNERCLESDAIARFERPREYRFVEFEVPRTPSQKIDRKEIVAKLEDVHE